MWGLVLGILGNGERDLKEVRVRGFGPVLRAFGGLGTYQRRLLVLSWRGLCEVWSCGLKNVRQEVREGSGGCSGVCLGEVCGVWGAF